MSRHFKHSNTWSNLSMYKPHSHTFHLTSMDWNSMEYAVCACSVRYFKISKQVSNVVINVIINVTF